MSVVDVVEVSLAEPSPNWLWGRHIDAPKKGTTEEIYAITIGGWVLGRPRRAVSVEVLHEGCQLRKISVNVPRPDITQVHPGVAHAHRCGFRSAVGVLGLPPEFELVLQAVLEDGIHVPLGTIRGRKQLLGSGFEPRLQPLMITSLGRTGTTWLMRLLSEHASIVAHRVYPYETRSASYWMHMLKVLAEPANLQQSAHPDNFHYNPWWVGHHPSYLPAQIVPQLRHWFGHRYVEQLAGFCQSRLEEFYWQVAGLQNQEQPAYLAEKFTPGPIPWLIWELYPRAREIVLIRDFRDMVCSILATNTKRGAQDFGRAHFATDEAYVQALGRNAHALFECWRQRSSLARLVRYEDLVLQPLKTVREIFRYLNLDATDASLAFVLKQASVDTPELAQHRTSSDVRSSVGRWKHDLPVALQAACQDAFGTVLTDCGYAHEGGLQEGRRAKGREIA